MRNKLTEQRTKALETEKATGAEIAELKEERQQLIKKRIEDSKRIEELEGDKVIILLLLKMNASSRVVNFHLVLFQLARCKKVDC